MTLKKPSLTRIFHRVSDRETLIYCLRGMKCKAHGAQEPRHIL